MSNNNKCTSCKYFKNCYCELWKGWVKDNNGCEEWEVDDE